MQIARGSTQCAETDCFDGLDNDGDGNTDCTDSECYRRAACQIYGFDGAYAMDVTISTGNASVDDCIGTLNITLTTDGYNHADMAGTGTCTSTALGSIALSIDGFAFQNSGTTSTFGGLITHVNASNETFYGNIVNGNLVFDALHSDQYDSTHLANVHPHYWCTSPGTGLATY